MLIEKRNVKQHADGNIEVFFTVSGQPIFLIGYPLMTLGQPQYIGTLS